MSSERATRMAPSAATRPAFLSALARPRLRINSTAASISPFVSTSAFLHSIIPEPVRSRSCLTRAALIAIQLSSHSGSIDATTVIQKEPELFPGLPRGLGLRLRLPDLHEVVTGVAGRHRRLARVLYRVGHAFKVELDRTDGVVITRNYIIHFARGVVGVHDSHHRNPQLAGFLQRDALVTHVDDEHRVRQAFHVFDTGQTAVELIHLAVQHELFFLAEPIKSAVGFLRLQIFQAPDGLFHSPEVGEHAAQPTMIDVRHTAALRRLAHRVARRPLGADDQYPAALRHQAPDKIQSLIIKREGLLQVDDMNLVAFAEDVRSHLRVPVTGLVSEVNPRLQHLTHGYLSHGKTPNE